MSNVITDTPSKVVAELVAQVNALVTDITVIRTAMTAHVHGGVTAGGANTSAVAAIAALTVTAVTLNK